MADYAIGDVQGCYDSLEALLGKIRFDPAVDRVWLAGDLVNRGPKSLEVLRWARSLGDRVIAVLGNCDLYLLGRAAGVARKKKRDTLEAVLAAPDRDEILDWLRRRPLVHRQGEIAMVHAGLLPSWSLDDAERLAGEVEAELRGDDWPALLAARPHRDRLPRWSEALTGTERHQAILSALVDLRTCTAEGDLCRSFAGPPDETPEGFRPWYEHPHRRGADARVIFGHWAALGLHLGPGHIALDSGCVWGNAITAIRLHDRRVFQQAALE